MKTSVGRSRYTGSTTKAASGTNKTAADTAKTNADNAIANWETLSELDFDTDTSVAAKKAAYDAAVGKIDAYNAAATEFAAITAGYASNTITTDGGTLAITITNAATDWTYAFQSSTPANGTVDGDGTVTAVADGPTTISGTAKKAGYVDDLTITNATITMSNQT